jgi:arsenate reductase
MEKKNLIIICTGNSARSQMAEAIFRRYAGQHYTVYSAGLDAHGINPYTIRIMEELGYDLGTHTSKNLSEYYGKISFDTVITVCSNAEQNCPTIPGVKNKLHWPFEDPATAKGSDEEIMDKFRDVRDQIENKIKEYLKELNLI